MHETKEDVKQGVLCEFYEIFQNTFFIEQFLGLDSQKKFTHIFGGPSEESMKKRLVCVLPDFVLKISEKEC